MSRPLSIRRRANSSSVTAVQVDPRRLTARPGIAHMGALSAVGVLPTPPPPGVSQRLGMHEAGGLSAVGPIRGRPGCLLPCPWGAPWDTRSDDPGPLSPGAGRPSHRTRPPVGAAVEAFFVHRDLAPNSRRVYRAALEPLVAAVGADQPLAALTPAAVAQVHRSVG